MKTQRRVTAVARMVRRIGIAIGLLMIVTGGLMIAFRENLPAMLHPLVAGLEFLTFGIAIAIFTAGWSGVIAAEIANKRKLQGLALFFPGFALVIISIFALLEPSAKFPFFSAEFWSLIVAGVVLQTVALLLLVAPGIKIYSYADHGPFVFAKNQPWRQHSTSPYVEFLKAYLERIERDLETEACWPKHWKWAEEQIASFTTRISKLTSDREQEKRKAVEFERRLLEAEIKRLRLAAQEHQRQLGDAEPTTQTDVVFKSAARMVQNMGLTEQAQYLANRRRIKLQSLTYGTDVQVADLEGYLRELQDFNFQVVCEDLPANLSGVPHQHLEDIKAKVDTINQIPLLKERPSQASRRSGSTISEQIAEQEALIDELERDRDQELSGICTRAKVERFEDLPSTQQDQFVEAENSWEAKLRSEREKMRSLKQSRRAVR